MQFLVGNGMLAFGVFFVICLFLYLSFRTSKKAGDEDSYAEVFAVTLDSSLAGEDISVFINDSLLVNKKMDGMELSFKVKKFAEESVLMVVDNKTESITPLNLNPHGCRVEVLKKENKMVIEER